MSDSDPIQPEQLTGRARSLANLKPWQPGHAPLTKPNVAGRAVLIKRLDTMLAEPEMQQMMVDALRAYAERSPIPFFKTIVMPLLPQNIKMELGLQMHSPWGKLDELIKQHQATLKGEKIIDIEPADKDLGL